MKNPPNLFSFATSELSQDATLCYLLAWADDSHADSWPEMHALGRELISLIIQRCLPAISMPTPISSVMVNRGVDRIDIKLVLNDEILIIIEDKTGTNEGAGQIQSYLDVAKELKNCSGLPYREIGAVYIKTRDESQHTLSKSHCGVILRPDLITVLEEHTMTNNTIVNEFCHHLEHFQRQANAYLTEPLAKPWDRAAIAGFYTALQKRLTEAHQISDSEWRTVNNMGTEFLGFWWHYLHAPSLDCTVYLQIEGGRRLQLRLAEGSPKIDKTKLWEGHHLAMALLQNHFMPEISFSKSGRYKGGVTGACVDFFADEPYGFCVATSDGRMDFDKTVERILAATTFAKALRGQLAALESEPFIS